uniref:SH3 domain-containing protein n=1 Tax=Rhabditophanes sp. KR3021 TaxID=114890 RepID=A0AC35UGE3_9BILA
MEERHHHAIRSFTESIDMDLPPAPELPSNLDIDKYEGGGMVSSSTQDTIIELSKEELDANGQLMGETHKYLMTVPGPGHTDQEQEQHQSLLKETASPDGSDDEVSLRKSIEVTTVVARPGFINTDGGRERDEMGRKYRQSMKERPRPTTPLTSSVLESFVGQSTLDRCNSEVGGKITVKLPSKDGNSRLNDRASSPWQIRPEDPFASGQSSRCRKTSESFNLDGDLLEDNYEFRNKAPVAPVVHRRSSVDWEAFEDCSSIADKVAFLHEINMERAAEASEAMETGDVKNEENAVVEIEVTEMDSADSGNVEHTAVFTIDSEPENMDEYGTIEAAIVDTSHLPEGVEYTDDGQFYLADDGQWYPVSALLEYNQETEYYGAEQYDYNNYPQEETGYYGDDSNIVPTMDTNVVAPIEEAQSVEAYQNGEQYYDNGVIFSEDGQYYLASDNQWYPVDINHEYYDETMVPAALDDVRIDLNNEQLPDQVQLDYDANQEDEPEHLIARRAVDVEPEEIPEEIGIPGDVEEPMQAYDYSSYGRPAEADIPPSRMALNLFSKAEIGQLEKVADPYAWGDAAEGPELQEERIQGSASNIEEAYHQEEVSQGVAASLPPRPAGPPVAKAGPPARPSAPIVTPKRPPPPSKKAEPAVKAPEEEDAWARFNKMSSNITSMVKQTEESLKHLGETSTCVDIKDESYMAEVGGSQGTVNFGMHKQMMSADKAKKDAKAEKKLKKHLGIKKDLPDYSPEKEEEMDRKAAELAQKLSEMRDDIGDWKKPEILKEEAKSVEPNFQRSNNWAGFDDTFNKNKPTIVASDSDFFKSAPITVGTITKEIEDPFQAPGSEGECQKSSGHVFDPFDVKSADEVMAELEAKVEQKLALRGDEDYYDGNMLTVDKRSNLSTPTQEGGSPISHRPMCFDDEFTAQDVYYSHTPTPLFDEDETEAIPVFREPHKGDGWDLLIRHPFKKKLMGDRFWKPCFCKLEGNYLKVYNDRKDPRPLLELLLQATYSISDSALQPYDAYGKLHTVKLQYVLYKEKVGIRQGQISRLVEGHVTKFGLPLEHSAQITVLAKFGATNSDSLTSFISAIEDVLFHCDCKRETNPVHTQDEVQIHCYDEYFGYVDLKNALSQQKARVRLYCLSFLTGKPSLEIGLNDRRRQGKEIVRRKDILPMFTERWIVYQNIEFHSTIDQTVFIDEHYLKLSPPDGVFFEIMRFRIRPPKNKEKPLSVRCIMKIAGSKIEIRIEAMAAASTQKHKEDVRTIPCEDIQIKFPIPEAWIYLFREERTWGVGSIHSKSRRPGKVKNLKDKLLGAVKHTENSMIEVAIGEAKYEHLFRSLVWRIPKLPEKHHEAYKTHLLTCRFELSSFDLMPEAFLPVCDVDFTMPLSTVSNTVVRSIGVEAHEDSDRVEKFVRYVSKYNYKFEIDYFHCDSLDAERGYECAVEKGVDEVKEDEVKGNQNDENDGNIKGFDELEINDRKFEQHDSSSDEEDAKPKKAIPMVQISMKGYEATTVSIQLPPKIAENVREDNQIASSDDEQTNKNAYDQHNTNSYDQQNTNSHDQQNTNSYDQQNIQYPKIASNEAYNNYEQNMNYSQGNEQVYPSINQVRGYQVPIETSGYQAPIEASGYQAPIEASGYEQAPVQTTAYQQQAPTTTPVQNPAYQQGPITTPIQTSGYRQQAPVQTSAYDQAPVQNSVYSQQAPVQNSVYPQQAPVQTSAYDQAPMQTSGYQHAPIQTSVYQQASIQSAQPYQQGSTNTAPIQTSTYQQSSIYPQAALSNQTSMYQQQPSQYYQGTNSQPIPIPQQTPLPPTQQAPGPYQPPINPQLIHQQYMASIYASQNQQPRVSQPQQSAPQTHPQQQYGAPPQTFYRPPQGAIPPQNITTSYGSHPQQQFTHPPPNIYPTASQPQQRPPQNYVGQPTNYPPQQQFNQYK